MKLLCQTFSKTTLAPLEKLLHLRSQSCFWKSRSPAKQALSFNWTTTAAHVLRLLATCLRFNLCQLGSHFAVKLFDVFVSLFGAYSSRNVRGWRSQASLSGELKHPLIREDLNVI